MNESSHLKLRISVAGVCASDNLCREGVKAFQFRGVDYLLNQLRERYDVHSARSAEYARLRGWHGLSDWIAEHPSLQFCVNLGSLDILSLPESAVVCMKRHRRVTWIAQLSLTKYLAHRDSEWIQAWKIVKPELWRADQHSDTYPWTGDHKGVEGFVDNHWTSSHLWERDPRDWRKLPIALREALSSKEKPTIFDEIWAELDPRHQQQVITLVQNPGDILPAGYVVLEEFGFCHQEEDRWVWFSSLFAAYVFFFQTWKGKSYRGVPALLEHVRRRVINQVQELLADRNIWGRWLVAILAGSAAIAGLFWHPWLATLLLVLAVVSALCIIKLRLSKELLKSALKSPLESLFVIWILACTGISFWRVGEYLTGERLTKFDAANLPVSLFVSHPYWISSGDSFNMEIDLRCKAEYPSCPVKTDVFLHARYPEIEFAETRGQKWTIELLQDDWKDDRTDRTGVAIRMRAGRRDAHTISPASDFPSPLGTVNFQCMRGDTPAYLPIDVRIEVLQSQGLGNIDTTGTIWIDVLPRSMPCLGSLLDRLEPDDGWKLCSRMNSVWGIVKTVVDVVF